MVNYIDYYAYSDLLKPLSNYISEDSIVYSSDGCIYINYLVWNDFTTAEKIKAFKVDPLSSYEAGFYKEEYFK